MHQIAKDVESATWRHPNGARHSFQNGYVEELIAEWKETGDLETLGEILTAAAPLIEQVCRYRCTDKYEELEELIAKIQIKLMKSVRHFDPERGKAYSFVSHVIKTMSCSLVQDRKNYCARVAQIEDDTIWDKIPAPEIDSHRLEDLAFKVRRVRTTCSDIYELRAQRWIVESFIDAGFKIRRHEVANACMFAFGLSHERSRQLHDLTLLEIRRQLIGERRLREIRPGDLERTKIRAIIPFARYMNGQAFTRFATLMTDLAPSLVILVKVGNAGRIRRGEPEAIRENLGLVIHGDPTALPLFRGI